MHADANLIPRGPLIFFGTPALFSSAALARILASGATNG
jgi:hypothetical protein